MGMILTMLRVSDEELGNYLADSSELANRIYAVGKASDAALTDLDKSWDGILYLLTGQGLGSNHPLSRLLFSGDLIDEEQDLGYGPAHYLEPDEVAELNAQIAGLQTDDLRQRFDPQQMNALDVYPGGVWDRGDEEFMYLADYFKDLQQVYSEAVANGQGIITWLS